MHGSDEEPECNNAKDEEDSEESENPSIPPSIYGCTESREPSPLVWNTMARLGPDTVGSAFTSPHSDITSANRKTLTEVSCGRGCFVQVSPSVLDEAAHVLASWRNNPVRAEHTVGDN